MVVEVLDAQAAVHPVVDAVAALHHVLDGMSPEAWAGLEPAAARRAVAELARVESRVQAQKLHAARRLDATNEARKVGATSTGDLLARDFGGDRRGSDQLVRTSKALPPKSATQTALDAGQVSFPQAQVIGKALGTVPDDKRDVVEQALLKDAQILNLKDLRRRADRSADAYAPRAEVDRIENATLEQRERNARRAAKFRMWDNNNGTYSGDFTIPEHSADMLRTAVEAIAAPRREYLREHNEVPSDHPNRLGMGFADLAEHLPTEELPAAGGVGATLTVNLDLETLTKGTRAATLSTGTRLSVAATRQLACRIGLIPMILDGKPLPLDVGEKRTFNRAQRRAMAKRDGGCTFPGCDRPPQWTEAHHLTPWSEGGTTNREDGCLVCPFHHRVIHADGWQLRISPVDGHIEYQAPGSTAWTRNHRYRAGDTLLTPSGAASSKG